MNKITAIAILVAATAVSQAFGRFTYSVLYTEIRDDFELSNTVAGGIGSLNLVGYLLGSLVVAFTIGAFGLTKTAKFGLLGVTTGLMALSWSPNSVVTLGALFLTGLAAAGVWITTPALAANVLGPDRKGLAIGWVTTGVGIGATETAIGICTLLLLAFTVKTSPEPTTSSGLSPATLKRVPGWFNLCATYGIFAVGASLAMTFSAALLEEDAGFKEGSASLTFALIGLGLALGGPTMGWLSDSIGRNSAQLVSFAALALSCILIATGHPIGAPVSTLLFGMAFTGVVINITTKVSGHLDDEAFGAAYALVTIVFGAGLAVGPQLGGIIADTSGSFRPALIVAACCAALGFALTLVDRKSEISNPLGRNT